MTANVRRSGSLTNDDPERAQSIVRQIRNLCAELEEIILADDSVDRDELHTSLAGSRVKILKGVNRGLVGQVVDRRGTHFWNIRLEEDGRMIYKAPQNFRVLSQATNA